MMENENLLRPIKTYALLTRLSLASVGVIPQLRPNAARTPQSGIVLAVMNQHCTAPRLEFRKMV